MTPFINLQSMKRAYITVIAAIASLLVGCGGSTKPSEESSNTQSDTACITTTRTMKRSVEDVRTLRTREEYEAMIAHYWDDFDFECGAEVAQYDTVDMLMAMSDYVLFIPRQSADSLLRSLIVRASQSREVLNFFTMLTEEVLHNPNSPLRNDEYYIPVLETILASPLLDEYDRIAPAYDLEIAQQNRIDCVANDFVYTLANGRTGRLHGIKAQYTILMFSNPGCPMCAEIIDEICASPLINEMGEMGRIEILNIYPDADIEAWRNYLVNLPAGWINGYDNGMVITEKRLYNLSAIPSLYLLDSQKRVLIKDGVSVAHIEDVIALMEAQ